ncbi:TetR/AcrR family transcriptional regulator [Nocardioides ferulae]|uniref:TetR/AcrR family transcriptional regulator n=1 Tax=Nocardioides ferulae TaxID=2340821 RepID=UPI000EABC220|nr:TetR/AcrR family transcriptional regulator [Nocardioides ferulae]
MDEPRPQPGGRRGRPGHDRDTVLRRAVELFNARGYAATSVGDLAAELGVSKSAIYHHVPSKEHLLAEALDEALDALTRALDRVSTGPGSAEDRLRAAVRAGVETLVAHQPAVTLLLRVHGNGAVEQAALARRRELDARLAGLVADAADAGAVRSDLPPQLVSRLLFGTVNSLVEWYRADGTLPASALADAVVAVAFEGLAPRS